jgi:hypothetical protein
MMFEKSETQNWEVCQVFRFVQITRTWNTLWQLKAYRVTNEVVSYTVTIQLLHTILVRKSKWEQMLCQNVIDMLTDLSDDRVQHCMMQIIHLKMMSKPIQAASMTVVNISIPVLVQPEICSVKSQISSRCKWMLRQEMSCMRSCVKQFRNNKGHFSLF